MVEIDDGGTAFPTMIGHDTRLGMTLRDYFAAQAMQALQAHPEYGTQTDEWIARSAYSLARVMLAERAKQ